MTTTRLMSAQPATVRLIGIVGSLRRLRDLPV